MKVLLISDNHLCKGGAEQYFYDLKNQLKSRNNLAIVTLTFGDNNQLSGPDYILKAPKSKAIKFVWQVLFHPLIYRRLKKLINRINADIIHIHNIKQYTRSLCQALQGKIVVQTIHDYGAVCPVAWNIHKNWRPCPTGMTRQCFSEHHVKHPYLVYLAQVYAFTKLSKWQKKWVHYFLTPSPHLASFLQKKFSQPSRYIQPFLKDCETSKACTKKLDPEDTSRDDMNKIDINPQNEPLPQPFLFVGNIGRHKGIFVLLEEFAIAIQKNPRLSLNIAGDGSEVAQMQTRIKELGLQNHVNYLGWQNNLEILYDRCIALVFPSLWLEAFGLVLVDAMSRGKPVIGSNRGSPTWLIQPGESGYLFDPARKGDLAQKLLEAAANPNSMKQMGLHAKQYIAGMKKNSESLEEIIAVYKELTSSEPSRTYPS